MFFLTKAQAYYDFLSYPDTDEELGGASEDGGDAGSDEDGPSRGRVRGGEGVRSTEEPLARVEVMLPVIACEEVFQQEVLEVVVTAARGMDALTSGTSGQDCADQAISLSCGDCDPSTGILQRGMEASGRIDASMDILLGSPEASRMEMQVEPPPDQNYSVTLGSRDVSVEPDVVHTHEIDMNQSHQCNVDA